MLSVVMVVLMVKIMGDPAGGTRRRGGGGGWGELAGLEGLLSVEIVDLALLGITENVVCFGNLLELGLGLDIIDGVLVRVPYHGEPLVRLLQIIIARVPVHFQNVIVIHPHLSLFLCGNGGNGRSRGRWSTGKKIRRLCSVNNFVFFNKGGNCVGDDDWVPEIYIDK